jgi:hypothetical protein
MRVALGGRGLEVRDPPRRRPPDLVVRPEDPLDLQEAQRLAAALESLPPGVCVRVDLSAVRDVHPTGLAALARVVGDEGSVTLGGLRRHEERLLAYLRATPPEPPPGPRRPPTPLARPERWLQAQAA